MTDPFQTATATDNLSFSSLSSDYASSDVHNRSSLTARPNALSVQASSHRFTGPAVMTTMRAAAAPRRTSPSHAPLLVEDDSRDTYARSPSPTHHDRLLSGGERFYDDDEDIPLSQIERERRRASTMGSTTTTTTTTTGAAAAATPRLSWQRRENEGEGLGGSTPHGGRDDTETSPSGLTSPSSTRTRQSSSYNFVMNIGAPTFLHDTHRTATDTASSSHQRLLSSAEKEAMAHLVTLTSSFTTGMTGGDGSAAGTRGAAGVANLGHSTVASKTGAPSAATGTPLSPLGRGGDNNGSGGGGRTGKKSLLTGSGLPKSSGTKDTFEWERVEAYLWAAYTALRTNDEGVMASFKAPKHRMGWYTIIYSACNHDPSMSWGLYVRLAVSITRALEVLVLYPLLQRTDQRIVSIRTDADSGTMSSGTTVSGTGAGGSATAAATAGGAGNDSFGGSPQYGSAATPSGTPNMRPSGGSFHFMRRFFFGNDEDNNNNNNSTGHSQGHGTEESGSVRGVGAGGDQRRASISAASAPASIGASSLIPAMSVSSSSSRTKKSSRSSKSKHGTSSSSGAAASAAESRHNESPLSVCAAFNKEYADFIVFQRIVLSCFSYLDQAYTQRFGMDKIATLCLKTFYLVIFQPLRQLVLYEIISRARQLRDVASKDTDRSPASTTAHDGEERSTVTTHRTGAHDAEAFAGDRIDATSHAWVVSDAYEQSANLITDTIGFICELITSIQARPSYLITVESATAAAVQSGGARQSPSPAGTEKSGFLGLSFHRHGSRPSSAASSVVNTPRLGPTAQSAATLDASGGLLSSPTSTGQDGGGTPSTGQRTHDGSLLTSMATTTATTGAAATPTTANPSSSSTVSKRRRFLNFWTRKDEKDAAASRASSQSPAPSSLQTGAGLSADPTHIHTATRNHSVANSSSTSSAPGDTSHGPAPLKHEDSGTREAKAHEAGTRDVTCGVMEMDLRAVIDLRAAIDLRQRLDNPQLVRALGLLAYHYTPHASSTGSMGTVSGGGAGGANHAATGGGVGSRVRGVAAPRGSPTTAAHAFPTAPPNLANGGGSPQPHEAEPSGSIVMDMTESLDSLVHHIFADTYLDHLGNYYRAARTAHLGSAEGRRRYIAWIRRVWDMEHDFVRKSNIPLLHHLVRRRLTDVLITAVHREVILDPINGFGALLDIWSGIRGDDGLVAAVLDAPVGAVQTRASVHARHTTTASFSLFTGNTLRTPAVAVAGADSAGDRAESASFGGRQAGSTYRSRGRAYVQAEEMPSAAGSMRRAGEKTVRVCDGPPLDPTPTEVEMGLAVGQFFWAFTRAEHDESCLLLLASILASRVISAAAVTVRGYVECLAGAVAAATAKGGVSAPPPSTRTATTVNSVPCDLLATGSAHRLVETAADNAMEELLSVYQRCRALIEVEMRGHTVMMSAMHDALREVVNPHRWTRRGALAASEMRVRAMDNVTNQAGTAGGAWQLPSVLLSKDAGARATAPLTSLAEDLPFSASLCVPELIATYCDHIMQRQFTGTGAHAPVTPEVDFHFRAIGGLASLLDDKDVLLEHMKLRLSRRLLDLSRPTNLSAEHALVQALQYVFSLEDIYSLELMLRDTHNGQVAADQFGSSREYADMLANTSSAGRLRVRVLTCVGWPASLELSPTQLPRALQLGVNTFEAFYARHHPYRRLQWAHALASVVLTAELPRGQKEVVANIYQAVLLLLVSESSSQRRQLHDAENTPSGMDRPSTTPSRVFQPSDLSECASQTQMESSFASALSASRVGGLSPANGPLDADAVSGGVDDDMEGEQAITATPSSSLAAPPLADSFAPAREDRTGCEEEEPSGWISGQALASRMGLTFAQIRPHLASITLHAPTALLRRLPPRRGHTALNNLEGQTSTLDNQVSDAPEGLTAADAVPAASRAKAQMRSAATATAFPTPTASISSIPSTRSTATWSRAVSTAGPVPLQPSDRFSLNRDFAHPQRRLLLPARRRGLTVRLPSADAKGQTSANGKPWQSETAAQVEQSLKASRATRMDAVMIRIMKSRRTLPFVELVALATEQLAGQFLPTNREFKERLSALIERGFLERPAYEENTVNYLA